MDNLLSLEQLHQAQIYLRDVSINYWLQHDLFSIQWWLLILVLILPWVIWWKYADKSRIVELSLFGFFVIVIVLTLDSIGSFMGLWAYNHKLLPVYFLLYPVDFSSIIVAHLFIYQYFKSWKSYLIAETILALLFSFVMEPVSVWIKIYVIYHWKHIYSFPIYILKGAFVKWVVMCVLNIEKRYKKRQD